MTKFLIVILFLIIFAFVGVDIFKNLKKTTNKLDDEESDDFDEEIKVHDTTTAKGRESKAKEIMTIMKAKLRPEDIGRFEIYKGDADEFKFKLFDSNDNIVLISENYKRKANCIKGINSVKKNAIDSSKFTFQKSGNNKNYFTLRATNGRTLGKSQFYANTAEALKGMELVIVQAVNNAEIKDLTV